MGIVQQIKQGEGTTLDEYIVKEGFIIASGSSLNPAVRDTNKEYLMQKPFFGVFSATNPSWSGHESMLIRRIAYSNGVTVKPNLPPDDPRLSGEYWKDSWIYDLACVFMFPNSLGAKLENFEEIATIDNAFVTPNGKQPVTLALVPYNWHFEQNDLEVAYPTLQTQIPFHFFDFLMKRHHIFSPDKGRDTVSMGLRGIVEIPIEDARELTKTITKKLEQRFSAYFYFQKQE